jgi:hypothetical protein
MERQQMILGRLDTETAVWLADVFPQAVTKRDRDAVRRSARELEHRGQVRLFHGRTPQRAENGGPSVSWLILKPGLDEGELGYAIAWALHNPPTGP